MNYVSFSKAVAIDASQLAPTNTNVLHKLMSVYHAVPAVSTQTTSGTKRVQKQGSVQKHGTQK